MQTELINKITNEQKDKALKIFCDKIQMRFQNDFGPIMAIYILMQETAHNLKRYWT